MVTSWAMWMGCIPGWLLLGVRCEFLIGLTREMGSVTSLKYIKQLPSVTHPAVSCSSASHPGGDFFSGTRQLKLALVCTVHLSPSCNTNCANTRRVGFTSVVLPAWSHRECGKMNRCPCYCTQAQWPPLMM